MFNKQIWVLIISFLSLGVALFTGLPLKAQEVSNIGLLQFVAVPVEEGIRLQWDVETEIGTAGYTIKRGENGSFDYLPDPGGDGSLFVLAEGGPAQAYSYVVLDESAVRETTYTYKLIEILGSSSEQEQAEVTVTFHIEPTPTPITFSGGLGTPEGGGSTGPAATPTATQPPTATAAVQATATNPPPPTVLAPTPLPSPTPVAAVVAASNPVNNAPAAPTTVPVTDSAYPAENENPQEIGSDGAESLAYLQEAQEQEEASEISADSSAGVAIAMEADVSEQLDLQNEQPAVQTGDTSPVVIRGTGSKDKKTEHRSEARQQVTDEEPVNADSSRVLLWLAFIVALLIFSASVVGAILLYSRRRPIK